MKECTFEPKINGKNKMFKSKYIEPSHGMQQYVSRIDQLKQPKLRVQKSQEDIEFDRQKNECLFKPKLFSKGFSKSPQASPTVSRVNSPRYLASE